MLNNQKKKKNRYDLREAKCKPFAAERSCSDVDASSKMTQPRPFDKIGVIFMLCDTNWIGLRVNTLHRTLSQAKVNLRRDIRTYKVKFT